MAGVDWSNAFLGGIVLVNIGGIVYVIKLVIAPLVQSVRFLTKDVETLYASRNGHEQRITKIETVHEVKGCNKPSKG